MTGTETRYEESDDLLVGCTDTDTSPERLPMVSP